MQSAITKAYHVIQIENANSILTPSHDLHNRFLEAIRSIRASGSLTSVHGRSYGHISIWDKYAGDDHYIFSSLGKRYLYAYKRYTYGYIFDAISLIKNLQAMVGIEDLARDYHRAVLKSLDEAYQMVKGCTIAPYRSNIPIEHGEVLSMPLDKQYLYHAVADDRIDFPGVAEFRRSFRHIVAIIQEEKRFSGDKAIDFVQEWTRSCSPNQRRAPEILVPNTLPLSYAIGLIIKGRLRLY